MELLTVLKIIDHYFIKYRFVHKTVCTLANNNLYLGVFLSDQSLYLNFLRMNVSKISFSLEAANIYTTLLIMSTFRNEIPKSADQSLHLGFLEVFNGVKSLNSTVVFPQASYNCLLGFSVDATAFHYMILSVCEKVASSPKCLRDIKSVTGAKYWEQGIAKAFCCELYMVAKFIEYANSAPQQIAMESYAAFIKADLTPGAARYLFLNSKQKDVDFLGYDFGRVTTSYVSNLSSSYIADYLCPLCGVDKETLPKQGVRGDILLCNDDAYIFNTLFDTVIDFKYSTWNIENRTPIGMPIGNAVFSINASGKIDSWVLDCSRRILRSEMAFNVIYGTTAEPLDNHIWWKPYNNHIYKVYVDMAPNSLEYRSHFMYIWTGMVDKGFDSDLSVGYNYPSSLNDQSPSDPTGHLSPNSNKPKGDGGKPSKNKPKGGSNRMDLSADDSDEGSKPWNFKPLRTIQFVDEGLEVLKRTVDAGIKAKNLLQGNSVNFDFDGVSFYDRSVKNLPIRITNNLNSIPRQSIRMRTLV
jgi:hypothetical protein